LFANHDTKILISYKITIGIDIIIKLIGSGGVMIADKITVPIIASLLYCLKKAGFIKPMDENKKEATGNSKIIPEPIINAKTKLK
tara:strand:+ start:293 stop:547 length:255 start_codon:yes stop_codon:yes gene_type:complete